jgi:hypothetical protein
METKLEKSFIEKRIEERANHKLDADINKLLKPLKESRLINSISRDMRIGIKIGEENLSRDLYDAIEYSTSLIGKAIKEKMLATYIKEETDEFMSKLDSLKYFLDENSQY